MFSRTRNFESWHAVATVLGLLAACFWHAPVAEAGFLFDDYNLGMSYEASTSYASIHYRAPTSAAIPEDCTPLSGGGQEMECTAYLAPDSDETPSPSLFLDAPFKRQGLLYFDYGLTFATLSYKGVLMSKPKSPTEGGQVSVRRNNKAAPAQPLTRAKLEMYGVNWQGYLRFGLTPRYIPDLLVTTGLGLQTVAGRVKILLEDKTRFVVQPDAFAVAELVLLRFKGGALSVYFGYDQSLVGGNEFIDDYPSGSNMHDFHLGLSTSAAGVNLLFPF